MTIKIESYNPNWCTQYQIEQSLLQSILGSALLEIHHIGSTSIPQLKAKPIIDILCVVSDIRLIDAFNQDMLNIGYNPLGEYGLSGRRFFVKTANSHNEHTHHLHIFDVHNQNQIIRHLAFRDYLREHPKDAKRYEELKERLACIHSQDRHAYTNGKSAFIKEIEQQAQRYFNLTY
ncbi:GrpB family protein [Staphylococcus felis]|uniref:GrpB family protein n=1 Tax=Staphylococcus felis TaxID=46127 RepID=A0AAX1RW30_9STAP|nr:GrpB family protein [Staphylococcus felis]REH77492.1 GrpB family protein [Staphylococcus felis]REH81613.1 GrpB family protein [Staphylococcus felis]REH82686.1 GrpB family protein [Staphylococcus felis]REH82955.1 GrpB family protein [Staphylococcus felis]REH90277.1 GrpB family protein [Staphylococcus felis]